MNDLIACCQIHFSSHPYIHTHTHAWTHTHVHSVVRHVPLPLSGNIERNTNFLISLRNFFKHLKREKEREYVEEGYIILSEFLLLTRISSLFSRTLHLLAANLANCLENQTRNAYIATPLFPFIYQTRDFAEYLIKI